jgi:hypothetical protein
MTEGKTKLQESKYPLTRDKTVYLDKLLSEAQRELFLHAANRFDPGEGHPDWALVSLSKLREVINEVLPVAKEWEPEKKEKKAKKKK